MSSTVNLGNIVNRAVALENKINANKKLNIFISYCWSCRPEQVRTIADRLEGKGYNVWLDVKVLDDRLFPEIAKGIDECHLFLMFFNDAYIASDNCEMEATYALKTVKKPTLAVNMTGKKPEGNWLALILQDRVWISFGSERNIDQVFEEIVERIRRRFEHGDVEGFADHCSYSFIPVHVPNFSATGYYSRTEDEDRIFKQILETCENPGSGVLVVAGDGGVGKTTLVARLFVNKRPGSCDAIVLWLNCFRWRDDEQLDNAADKAFAEELLSLAKLADSNFNGQSIATILPHFRAKNANVLFVFDDMFSPLLLQRFVNHQTNSADLSCCAITRDPTGLTSGTDLIRAVEKLNALSNEGIRVMLETFYGMKDRLTSERLAKLSECCCGLPLIAGLIFAKFKFTDRSVWNLRCDKLLREELKNMQVHDKAERPFKTVSQLFQFSIEQLNAELRERYKVFLFFDPAVPISIQDLEIFWQLPRDSWETLEIIEQFEQRSLIRPAAKTSTTDENAYLVHQMLWEAARDMTEKAEGLQTLYTKLVITSIDPFEVAQRLRRLLLKQIIARIDAQTLSKMCLKYSPTSDPHKHCRRTFIHFLYHFNWPDNTQGVISCNYSYRMVADILFKMRSQHLLGEIAYATSEKQIGDEQEDSFLLDLFDDERELNSYFDRLPIIRTMKPWKTHYEEVKWQNSILASSDKKQLAIAAIRGRLGEFEILYSKANPQQDEAYEALIAAARCNAREVVAFLVRNLPPDVITMAADSEQRTVLHFAAANGHLEIARDLIEQQQLAQLIDAETKSGLTSLHFAAENGHLPIVTKFAERNRSLLTRTSKDGGTVLHSAAVNGDVQIVAYLVEQCPALVTMTKRNGWTALHSAAENGNIACVRYLTEKQTSLLTMTRDDGWTVLHSAASNGHLETFTYLVNHHGSLVKMARRDGRTVLHTAVANGHLDIVQWVVEKQPDLVLTVDNDGWTVLHSAAANGHIEVARYLIEKHQKLLSMARNDGWTPLHSAVKNDLFDTVRFLVEKQPELMDTVTNTGVTVLHCAAEKGHFRIVQYLAEKRPPLITMTTANGSTPFHLAAENCNLEVVSHLADTCADVISMVRNDGWTALHCAIENEYADVVRYLVEKQPSLVDMPTKDGVTARVLAEQGGDPEIVNALNK